MQAKEYLNWHDYIVKDPKAKKYANCAVSKVGNHYSWPGKALVCAWVILDNGVAVGCTRSMKFSVLTPEQLAKYTVLSSDLTDA
jgi:hypothetical protein